MHQSHSSFFHKTQHGPTTSLQVEVFFLLIQSVPWSRIRNWKSIIDIWAVHFMEHIDRAVVSKAKTKKRIGRLVSTIRNEKIGKTFLLWTVGCQSRGYFGRDYLETWRYMIVWLSLLRASKRETQKKKKLKLNHSFWPWRYYAFNSLYSFVLLLVFFQSTLGHVSCDVVAFLFWVGCREYFLRCCRFWTIICIGTTQ